jgi:fibronectin-binding autotransporter adhesin
MAAAFAITAVTTASGTDATAVVGVAAAPAEGTVASGSTTGTFLDLALDASWVGGVKPSTDGTATFNSTRYVGMSQNLSFNKLRFTGSAESGPFGNPYYAANLATHPESVRTITVGSGGIENAASVGVRIGNNLVINVGSVDQPWTIGSGGYNFAGRVTGSATITVSGASIAANLWLRGNNSTTNAGYPTAFTGTWKIGSGGEIVVGETAAAFSSTLGAAAAGLVLNGGSLRVGAGTTSGRTVTVAASSLLRVANTAGIYNNNLTYTGGTTNAPVDLTLEGRNNSTGATNNLGGDLSGHVGSLLIGKTFSGYSCGLANTCLFSFIVGANHVVDGVDTTAQALIRAGSGTFATALLLNGTFQFNVQNADLTTGTTWRLVDTSNLPVTYGASFALTGFTVGAGTAGSRTWTRVTGNNTWTYSEATGTLSLSINGTPTLTPYTTGATNDLSLGIAWSTGTVPGPSDIPDFTVAQTYTASNNCSFSWLGMTVNHSGGVLELNSSASDNNWVTINLGANGISGANPIDRLGNRLTIDVGANNQTWSVAMANVTSVVKGSATITYSGGVRLWLRADNSNFTGIWRADGGMISPEANTAWSGSGGAVGQLLNNGALRLQNVAYNRIAIEMEGSGRLIASGANMDDGSVSTFNRGTGVGTGTITGTGDLTIQANAYYGKIAFNGTCSHTGDVIIDTKSVGVYLNLGTSATNTFYISANGVNNKIRGFSASNSHLSAAGTFVFDLSAAELANNNAWTIVDVDSLNESFEATFTVDGFRKVSGLWRKSVPTGTWLFSESTGVLSFETIRGTVVQFL